jgi:hypothetical protein
MWRWIRETSSRPRRHRRDHLGPVGRNGALRRRSKARSGRPASGQGLTGGEEIIGRVAVEKLQPRSTRVKAERRSLR